MKAHLAYRNPFLYCHNGTFSNFARKNTRLSRLVCCFGGLACSNAGFAYRQGGFASRKGHFA
jgi:hypothetical protein